jgi:hypothetical protein
VAALVAIPLRRYPELRRRAYPQLLVGLAVLVVALALLAVYVP